MDPIHQMPFGVGREVFESLNLGVLDFVECESLFVERVKSPGLFLAASCVAQSPLVRIWEC